jgi:endoglycosylceramidase
MTRALSFILSMVFMVLLFAGCGSDEERGPFVTIKDSRFVDAQGCEIILHGINIIEKSKHRNYLSGHAEKEFVKMRDWGFNCIRLGILWDGIEPQPGVYDDEYLAEVDRRIQWAKENGIYVILDMHQDLFHARYGGDGAPDWALLDRSRDEAEPLRHGGVWDGVWSMKYFTSSAVQAAFDNFWANKLAPDGLGLQDHFALAWQHVAQRYADEPAVIGYDLFNEPCPGSIMLSAMEMKLYAAAEAIARKQSDPSIDTQTILRQAERSSAMKDYAEDIDLYKVYSDSGASLLVEFERTVLADFYNRMAKAIRQVDRNHILFTETNILCNSGTPSGVVAITDQDGKRDMLQAFAPHGYDINTDTENVANSNAKRMEFVFARHRETADRLSVPVVVGEWGAFGQHANTITAAQIVTEQFEKHLFGDTYWEYISGMDFENLPFFPAVNRPYPAAIAGRLLSYESDLSDGRFRCVWKEQSDTLAASRIYIPARWFGSDYKVELKPLGFSWSFQPATDDSSSGYLIIPPTGQEVKRVLEIISRTERTLQ